MIYGIIDEKSANMYTSMLSVFNAIDNVQLDYNWLITDSEIVAKSEKLNRLNTKEYWEVVDGKLVPVFDVPEYFFLTGEELTDIVKEDDSQWIWGVLSGFEKDVPLEEILKYPLPEADGYGGFWSGPPSIQHPLASLEIVPWDSALVMLFCKKEETAAKFRSAFPFSRDINEYNSEP